MYIPIWLLRIIYSILGIVICSGIVLILFFAYMGYQFLKAYSK